VQVVVGGVSGLTAVVLLLGLAVTRLTASTKDSAGAVMLGVAIGGGLIGGFLVAPYLNGLARDGDDRNRDRSGRE
jgi:hypothetical protein